MNLSPVDCEWCGKPLEQESFSSFCSTRCERRYDEDMEDRDGETGL